MEIAWFEVSIEKEPVLFEALKQELEATIASVCGDSETPDSFLNELASFSEADDECVCIGGTAMVNTVNRVLGRSERCTKSVYFEVYIQDENGMVITTGTEVHDVHKSRSSSPLIAPTSLLAHFSIAAKKAATENSKIGLSGPCTVVRSHFRGVPVELLRLFDQSIYMCVYNVTTDTFIFHSECLRAAVTGECVIWLPTEPTLDTSCESYEAEEKSNKIFVDADVSRTPLLLEHMILFELCGGTGDVSSSYSGGAEMVSSIPLYSVSDVSCVINGSNYHNKSSELSTRAVFERTLMTIVKNLQYGECTSIWNGAKTTSWLSRGAEIDVSTGQLRIPFRKSLLDFKEAFPFWKSLFLYYVEGEGGKEGSVDIDALRKWEMGGGVLFLSFRTIQSFLFHASWRTVNWLSRQVRSHMISIPQATSLINSFYAMTGNHVEGAEFIDLFLQSPTTDLIWPPTIKQRRTCSHDLVNVYLRLKFQLQVVLGTLHRTPMLPRMLFYHDSNRLFYSYVHAERDVLFQHDSTLYTGKTQQWIDAATAMFGNRSLSRENPNGNENRFAWMTCVMKSRDESRILKRKWDCLPESLQQHVNQFAGCNHLTGPVLKKMKTLQPDVPAGVLQSHFWIQRFNRCIFTFTQTKTFGVSAKSLAHVDFERDVITNELTGRKLFKITFAEEEGGGEDSRYLDTRRDHRWRARIYPEAYFYVLLRTFVYKFADATKSAQDYKRRLLRSAEMELKANDPIRSQSIALYSLQGPGKDVGVVYVSDPSNPRTSGHGYFLAMCTYVNCFNGSEVETKLKDSGKI